MKKKKKVSPLDEYIKANRKGSREAEIENHGRPVSHNRVHVSKKVYNRKRDKADALGRLPYLFFVICAGLFHWLRNEYKFPVQVMPATCPDCLYSSFR